MKLILSLILTCATTSIFACSCMESSYNAAEILSDSDSLFLGIPAEDSKNVKAGEYGPTVVTKFSVIRGYKNATKKIAEVFSTDDNGANCGASFKKNEGLILVQTYTEEDGREWTTSCSLDYVSEDHPKLLQLIQDLNSL